MSLKLVFETFFCTTGTRGRLINSQDLVEAYETRMGKPQINKHVFCIVHKQILRHD
jgi:hypothetical protein